MSKAWMAWALPVAVIGIGAGVYGVIKLRKPPPAAQQAQAAAFEPFESTEVVEAKEVSWQATADLMGTVIAIRSVTVKNEIAGAVTKVGFHSGDVVEEGQVLIQQDVSLLTVLPGNCWR